MRRPQALWPRGSGVIIWFPICLFLLVLVSGGWDPVRVVPSVFQGKGSLKGTWALLGAGVPLHMCELKGQMTCRIPQPSFLSLPRPGPERFLDGKGTASAQQKLDTQPTEALSGVCPPQLGLVRGASGLGAGRARELILDATCLCELSPADLATQSLSCPHP